MWNLSVSFFLFNNVGKCAKLFTSERERQWGWKCSWIYLSATVTMSQCFFKRIFGFSFRWYFQVQVHITQVLYITSSHHWNFSFTTISNFARQSGTHLWNLQFTRYAPNIFIWKSLKSFKAIFCYKLLWCIIWKLISKFDTPTPPYKCGGGFLIGFIAPLLSIIWINRKIFVMLWENCRRRDTAKKNLLSDMNFHALTDFPIATRRRNPLSSSEIMFER